MGDDSSRSIVKTLKNEWSLFWDAFQGEQDETKKSDDINSYGKLEIMSLDQIRDITKSLVEDRKKLNQNLELVSKEIDLNSAKLDSLRLVGREDADTLKHIHDLHDLGQNLAMALSRLDKKLREIREKENELQEELLSS